MTQRARYRHAARPSLTRTQRSRGLQQGSTTAEFAIGVIAAVLIAVVLLHLVLSGFFEILLKSILERGLDLVVGVVATTTSWSLSDVSTGARSGLSAVSGSAAGWAGDTFVNTWHLVEGAVSAATSGAVSVSRATASGVGSIADQVVDATAGALRWAGGPVSSALPW